MRIILNHKLVLFLIGVALFYQTVGAQTYLDTIGVNLFRATTTNLNGSGVRVAQPEAYDPFTPPGTNTWEVDPASVGQPTNLFTYTSASGTSTTFTNTVGLQSNHADGVGDYIYGVAGEEATNVAHVDNYDANYFYNDIIGAMFPPNIGDTVVNQSFSFGSLTASDQETVDSQYDDYSIQDNVLFISAVNNGGQVCAPGTSYNCIGVGAYGGGSSVGPTIDNGRCKPDLVAPASETSYSTPMVTGAATVLIQAALRGDGGSNTNAAADFRTIKALLLNGAVKTSDWTNSTSSPLDARYGAGILNLFNSYQQFIGGQHGFNASNSVSQGAVHPPPTVTGTISAMSGWNFGTISSSQFVPLLSSAEDGVEHYFFNVTNIAGLNLTTTLVWERQQNQTNINHLALFLYNCANSNLITCCTSAVDNVQHIFISQLPPGTYDLQVWKAGGTDVTDSESYALVWEFSGTPMAIIRSGSNLNLTWSAYPAGLVLEAATNLNAPTTWSTNNLPYPVYTNGQETVTLSATNAARFFQLAPP